MSNRFTHWLPAALFSFLILLGGPARAQGAAPDWRWAIAPGAGSGLSTTLDAAGNVYVAGSFSGTAAFGNTVLTSVAFDDAFVMKLTGSGTVAWAVQAGGGGFERITGLAVDSSGHVSVTGIFDGPTATFGSTVLTNAGPGSDLFVARLTPAGAWQWSVRVGGAQLEESHGLALDAAGNSYLTGTFVSPSVSFGATTLVNGSTPGSGDVFVARLNPAGVWQWAVRAGGTTHDSGTRLSLDRSGQVYVAGGFTGQATFGTTTLTSSGTTNEFVARLDPAGSWQWVVQAGGANQSSIRGMAVDGRGNVAVTGRFTGPSITFGAITVPNTPGSILTEAFVARLSPAGVWQWGVRAGGTNDDQGDALAFDGSGQIYVTGRFSSPTITLGTTSLTNVTGAPSSDIYVARLDTAGGWQWAVQTGGGGSEHGAALVAAGPDNLYVTGNFTAPATFGSIVLPTHMGRPTMFVAHLSGTAQGLPGGGADNPSGVFPNPARETVRLTGAAGPTAQLVDGLGRVVRTVAVREGEAILDLRGLPSGLYVVRAGEAMRRLVVE